MLRLALMFFIVAVIAGLFGFTGIEAASADIARFLFLIFVALLLVAIIFGVVDRRNTPLI